jgi:hypothetical protein
MNAVIAQELSGTPRGSLPQNMYRAAYEQARLNALGSHPDIGPSPSDAHAVALETVRVSYPNFSPELQNESSGGSEG